MVFAQHTEAEQGFSSQHHIKQDMVVHGYDSNTWELGAGGPEVQGRAWLHKEFKSGVTAPHGFPAQEIGGFQLEG